MLCYKAQREKKLLYREHNDYGDQLQLLSQDVERCDMFQLLARSFGRVNSSSSQPNNLQGSEERERERCAIG